jgi:hypothetical protein
VWLLISILAALQEARVHRASIIQNYAAGMANLAGLSADINAFWQQLHPDTPDAEGRTERFREFQVRCCWHDSAAFAAGCVGCLWCC